MGMNYYAHLVYGYEVELTDPEHTFAGMHDLFETEDVGKISFFGQGELGDGIVLGRLMAQPMGGYESSTIKEVDLASEGTIQTYHAIRKWLINAGMLSLADKTKGKPRLLVIGSVY